jgi:hypothetical protein
MGIHCAGILVAGAPSTGNHIPSTTGTGGLDLSSCSFSFGGIGFVVPK